MILLDAAIPLIAVELPYMVLALIPVALIETVILSRTLNPGRSVLLPVLGANAASTLVGVPLRSILSMIVGGGFAATGIWRQNIFLESVIPTQRNQPEWQGYAVIVLIVVSAFLLSVFIEGFLLKRMLKPQDRAALRRAVWIANAVTYVLLVAAIPVIRLF